MTLKSRYRIKKIIILGLDTLLKNKGLFFFCSDSIENFDCLQNIFLRAF